MNTIVRDYVNPTNEWKQFTRKNKKKRTSWFYVIRIHNTKTKIRYIKIGTTERTINERFKKYKYNDYKIDQIYYVAELEDIPSCYQIENFFRNTWKELKGFNWIRNDRFKYFIVPKDFQTLIKNTMAESF